MNSVSVPNDQQYIVSFLQEVIRRVVDGTVGPLFVDYSNQRVIIGGTSISSSPATIEVATGDIKIVSSGNGVILPNRAGTAYYRLLIDNDGAITADPL